MVSGASVNQERTLLGESVTLTVSFFNQVYKWVLANLVLDVTLQWSCLLCYRICGESEATRVGCRLYQPTRVARVAKCKPVPLNPYANCLATVPPTISIVTDSLLNEC